MVIGAGTMGHGIAHVSAAAGFETRLFDVDAGARAHGLALVEANLDRGVELGKVEPAARNAAKPCPATRASLSSIGATTRVIPTAINASAQGGVLP